MKNFNIISNRYKFHRMIKIVKFRYYTHYITKQKSRLKSNIISFPKIFLTNSSAQNLSDCDNHCDILNR